jgi:hypothetical protein
MRSSPGARRLEKPSRTAFMLMGRGIARPYTAHSPAPADFEEALEVARESGDPLTLGYVLAHCGAFLCVDGDTAWAWWKTSGPVQQQGRAG